MQIRGFEEDRGIKLQDVCANPWGRSHINPGQIYRDEGKMINVQTKQTTEKHPQLRASKKRK